MILAFDTYYFGDKAKTVGIAFEKWGESVQYKTFSEVTDVKESYHPGEFYKRELPCILSLLKKIPVKGVECIIVDGFVYLDDNNKPGLGGRLFQELDKAIPVIGVAKTNFATIEKNKRKLLRGKSKHPLYITAAGMELERASSLINNMNGENRIPTLLKKLDRLTREN